MKGRFTVLLFWFGLAGAGQAGVIATSNDVLQYGVGKTRSNIQTGPGTTTFDAFAFNAFVDKAEGGSILGATLQGPLLGGTQTLSIDSNGAYYESLHFNGAPTTAKNNLNSNFADSTPGNSGTNYRLQIDTSAEGSPNFDVTFSLTGDLYPADIPLFTLDNGNWSGGVYYADTANHDTHFGWSFPTYNASTDVILFNIEPASGGGEIVSQQYQNSLVTGYTVGSSTFKTGTEYRVQLTFARLASSDTTSIPGAQGVAFYSTETSFTFVAVPEPSTYALMIVGLGFVWAGYRRRSAVKTS